MALQSTGPISLSDINIELGFASNARISLNDSAVRDLAGIPSGPISLSDFYGKASYDPALMIMPATINVESSGFGSPAFIQWDASNDKAIRYTSSGNVIVSPIINASEDMSDYVVSIWFDSTQNDFLSFSIENSVIPNNNLLSQSADIPFNLRLTPTGTPMAPEGTTLTGIITLKHIVTGTLKVCNVSMIHHG